MTPLYERAMTNLLFAMEMLCASLMFYRAYSKQQHWKAALGVGISMLIGLAMFLRWTEDLVMSRFSLDANPLSFLIVYIINLLSNLILAGCVTAIISRIYKTSAKNILFIAIASSTVRVIARCCFFLTCASRGIISSHIWGLVITDPVGMGLYLLVYLLVFTLVYRFFIRHFTEMEDELVPKRVLLPTCMITILGFLFANVNAPRSSGEYTLYLFLLLSEIMLSCLILILQFSALGWFRMRLQKTAMEQLYEGQQRQFILSQESMDTVNMNAHDLKHKVNAIISALDGKDNAILREELNGINNAISGWDTIYQTGCKPLDVVLTEKAQQCRLQDTELSVIADGRCLEPLSAFDIYVLFSNALDNAIEATAKIERPEERLIIIQITREHDYAIVRIENTYQDEPIFVNGTISTSKDNRLLHGYGIRSIEKTVSKYGGQMQMNVSEQLFHLSMILPCAE